MTLVLVHVFRGEVFYPSLSFAIAVALKSFQLQWRKLIGVS